MHSVKGAARAVSLSLVETACHRLEEVLAAVPRGQPTPPEVYELGFALADALDDARQRLARKQDLAGSPLEALLPRLAAAARGSFLRRLRGSSRGGSVRSTRASWPSLAASRRAPR